MVRRHEGVGSFRGAHVFPGGRVDDEDHALGARVAGLSSELAAAALRTVPAELALPARPPRRHKARQRFDDQDSIAGVCARA